jgi:hypothetical protein
MDLQDGPSPERALFAVAWLCAGLIGIGVVIGMMIGRFVI